MSRSRKRASLLDAEREDEREPGRWACQECGRVLGLVQRERGKGTGVLLFREAVVEVSEGTPHSLVFGEVTVSCTGCFTVRTWFPGLYELERLMRGRRRMRAED